MKILIIGAGAVGQVYGYHLSKDHDITFLVTERHVSNLKSHPLRLLRLSSLPPWLRPSFLFSPSLAQQWQTYGVTTLDDVSNDYDLVILTTSSTGIRRSNFVRNLNNALGSDTFWLSMLPGPTDNDYLIKEGRIHPDKLILGLITIVAYAAPIPKERYSPIVDADNVAKDDTNPNSVIVYSIPSPQRFSTYSSSPPSSVVKFLASITDMFNKSGLGGSVVNNLTLYAYNYQALFLPFLIALESIGWSWSRLNGDTELLNATVDASKELASNIAEWPAWKTKFIHPMIYKFIMSFGHYFVAFDMERYLQYHFEKVGDQTSVHVDDFITLGQKKGCAMTALKHLASFCPRLASNKKVTEQVSDPQSPGWTEVKSKSKKKK